MAGQSVEIPVLELEKDLTATKRALIAEARNAVVEDDADYIIFELLRNRAPRPSEGGSIGFSNIGLGAEIRIAAE